MPLSAFCTHFFVKLAARYEVGCFVFYSAGVGSRTTDFAILEMSISGAELKKEYQWMLLLQKNWEEVPNLNPNKEEKEREVQLAPLSFVPW